MRVNNMFKFKQTLLILAAVTLGSMGLAASANAEPTVYENEDRNIYIFHPENKDANETSDKKVYHGTNADYYKGPLRTGYDGPNTDYYKGPRRTIYNGTNVDYYKGPRRTIYNGDKVDYYQGPRGATVIKGPNRTYVKPRN